MENQKITEVLNRGLPAPINELVPQKIKRALAEGICFSCGSELEYCPLEPEPCLVVFPFSGTGVGAIEALRMRRDCIGIDINTKLLRSAELQAMGIKRVDLRESEEPEQEDVFDLLKGIG